MKYNKFVFQPGEFLTMLVICPYLRKTIRIELIIVAYDPQKGQYSYLRRGKNPLHYLPKEKKLYKKLLFYGHNLPFVLDTETDHWERSEYFHFVSSEPERLRSFLAEHCLTLTNRNKMRIAYQPLQPDEMGIKPRRLYTDKQIQNEDIIDDDCPFEV